MPESGEIYLTPAQKAGFDFNLARAKAFRHRDLKCREQSLEENEKLYYGMKKFNDRLDVSDTQIKQVYLAAEMNSSKPEDI